MEANEQERVERLTAAFKAEATKQVAQFPQYAGHFYGYVLGRIKRDVTTKYGLAFAEGEFVIMQPKAVSFQEYLTVWSLRNAVDTSVHCWDVEVVS